MSRRVAEEDKEEEAERTFVAVSHDCVACRPTERRTRRNRVRASQSVRGNGRLIVRLPDALHPLEVLATSLVSLCAGLALLGSGFRPLRGL